MDEKKLSAILKDEDFIEEVFTTATPQEVKELFEKKGLDLSDKETEKIIKLFEKNIEEIEDLPNDQLQSISSGTTQKTSNDLENFLISNTDALENAKRWDERINKSK